MYKGSGRYKIFLFENGIKNRHFLACVPQSTPLLAKP